MKSFENGESNKLRRRLFFLGSSCVAAMTIVAPALAQNADAAEDGAVKEIVVTGSRVITNGNNSPTPVTVVSTEDLLKVRPGTLADTLNTLPVFAGSQSQFSGGNPTPSAGGNANSNALSLRNLGALRTLLLLDGQRMTPTSGTGQVDADIVPQMLIKRVDVVTAGASAVYGSDAVAGVVNLIVDRTFNGLKIDGRVGISQRGDSPQQSIGIAYGRKIGDRGHFEASYQYQHDGIVPFASSRKYHNAPGVIGMGTAASPLQNVQGLRLASQPPGGLITGTGLFVGQTFITDGVLAPLVRGTPTNSANTDIGGGGSRFDGQLKGGLKSHQAYARFDYDVSDNVRAFVVGGYSHKLNEYFSNQSNFGPGTNLVLSTQNPYLPVSIRNAFAAAGQQTFRMNALIGGPLRRQHNFPLTETYFVNAGLEGSWNNFDWGLGATYGNNRVRQKTTDIAAKQPLYAALDAVVNPANGQIVCRATLVGRAPGCAPLNIFGPTAASEAALTYIDETILYTVRNKMTQVTGFVRNEPFSTWAGPVAVAISGEYRKTTLDIDSNIPNGVLADCTGINFNCTQGITAFHDALFTGLTAPVSQRVWEGAAEVNVPILKDVALAKEVNVSGAVRLTDYSIAGRYTTWKAGLDWHVDDHLTFRGTTSRDIRAPTLADLFAPRSELIQTAADLLVRLPNGQNPSPTVPLYTQGNPNLKSEIGRTTTIGVVWAPTRTFSMSLDAYRIKISNAIVSQTGSGNAQQLECYASGGTSPLCALQTRPLGFTNTTPANTVTSFTTAVVNYAFIKTEGFDFEANYRGSIADHNFALRGLVTYQPKFTNETPIQARTNAAGATLPKVRVTAFANFDITPEIRIDLQERWRSKLNLNINNLAYVNPKVPSWYSTNMTMTYSPANTKGTQFYLSVQNLFDREPEIVGGSTTSPGQTVGNYAGDDVLGRYFTFGVRARF